MTSTNMQWAPRPGDRVRVTFNDGSEPVESIVQHPESSAYIVTGPFDGWEVVDNGRATVEVISRPEAR